MTAPAFSSPASSRSTASRETTTCPPRAGGGQRLSNRCRSRDNATDTCPAKNRIVAGPVATPNLPTMLRVSALRTYPRRGSLFLVPPLDAQRGRLRPDDCAGLLDRSRVVELNEQSGGERQRLDSFAWQDAREEIPHGLVELGGAGHRSFLCPLSCWRVNIRPAGERASAVGPAQVPRRAALLSRLNRP